MASVCRKTLFFAELHRAPDMMKLYGYYRSSASFRIRIVLNFKGIDWEYIAVGLDKGQQFEDEHIDRNPMKLVPVLDTGEVLLAQSIAIAEYIETRAGSRDAKHHLQRNSAHCQSSRAATSARQIRTG
jgi:glutathione S-transferase